MTELMVGMQEAVRADYGFAAERVLGLLGRISVGEVESSDEISGVYGDVERLMARAQAARSRFADIGLEVSPFVAHLHRLAKLEQETGRP